MTEQQDYIQIPITPSLKKKLQALHIMTGTSAVGLNGLIHAKVDEIITTKLIEAIATPTKPHAMAEIIPSLAPQDDMPEYAGGLGDDDDGGDGDYDDSFAGEDVEGESEEEEEDEEEYEVIPKSFLDSVTGPNLMSDEPPPQLKRLPTPSPRRNTVAAKVTEISSGGPAPTDLDRSKAIAARRISPAVASIGNHKKTSIEDDPTAFSEGHRAFLQALHGDDAAPSAHDDGPSYEGAEEMDSDIESQLDGMLDDLGDDAEEAVETDGEGLVGDTTGLDLESLTENEEVDPTGDEFFLAKAPRRAGRAKVSRVR